MDIISGREHCDALAADAIADALVAAVAAKGHAVLAIPGGRSVSGVFARLATEPNVPWEQVHLFMVDERLVPLEDEESNYRLAKEGFLDSLVTRKILPATNLHPFTFDRGEEEGCTRYAAELREHGGRFDVVLLSAGEDGHVAGLYPDHHASSDEQDGTALFLTMHDSPKPPPERMTSSRALLERSGTGVLLFYGEAKRDALRRFRGARLPVAKCPAKIVESMGRRFVFSDIVD